jgi:hypothetical protein
MKKFLFIASFFTYAATTSYAQTSDAETDALVNLLGVQKKQAMGKLVSVSEKDSAAFWKIYSEYQQKNFAMAKDRIKLYEQTAFSYNNLTPKIADSLAQSYFNNRAEQEKSLEEYYKKIKAATNATVAFQFFQAEVYLLTQIRASIMQQVPTYGEVQLTARKKE